MWSSGTLPQIVSPNSPNIAKIYSRLWMHCFFPFCHVIHWPLLRLYKDVSCRCGVREGFPGPRGFSKVYRLSHFSITAVSREVSRFIWRRLTPVMSRALVAGLNQCIPPQCHSFRFHTLMQSDLSFNVFWVSPRFTPSTLPCIRACVIDLVLEYGYLDLDCAVFYDCKANLCPWVVFFSWCSHMAALSGGIKLGGLHLLFCFQYCFWSFFLIRLNHFLGNAFASASKLDFRRKV